MLSAYGLLFLTIISRICCIWSITASAAALFGTATTAKAPDKSEWVKQCAAEYERKYSATETNEQKQQRKLINAKGRGQQQQKPQDESSEEHYPINYEPAFKYDKLHVSEVILPLKIHRKSNGTAEKQPTRQGQQTTNSATGKLSRTNSNGHTKSSSESVEDRWEEPRKRSRNRKSDERKGRRGESDSGGDKAPNGRYQSESDETEEESEERSGKGSYTGKYHGNSRDGSRSMEQYKSDESDEEIYKDKSHGKTESGRNLDERTGNYYVHRHHPHFRPPTNAQHPFPSMGRHRYHPYHRSRHYPPVPLSPPFWPQRSFPPATVFQQRLSPAIEQQNQLQNPQKQQQQSSKEQQTAVKEETQTDLTNAHDPPKDIDDEQQQQQQTPTPPPSTEAVPKLPQPTPTQPTESGGPQQRPRRPSRCVRKAVERCSSFSRCADGTDQVQNCWHKGDDMVFDETTQECRSFMTLPDCQRDTYCAGRPLGPTSLGGFCSKVAIVCGIPQQQQRVGVNDDAPFVCRGAGVLHPRAKDSCVDGRRVPNCVELLS